MRLAYGGGLALLIFYMMTTCYAAPCDLNNGDCHVNATCTVVNNAASCSCKPPYVGDGTHCTVPCGAGYYANRFTGKCKTIEFAFSTNLRILSKYIPQYDNTSSPEYLAMKRKIESTVNSRLHTGFDGYEVAQVTSFRAGTNNDFFYVDFHFVMNKYMENSFLFSAIMNHTVNGEGFKTLNVDKTYTQQMLPFNKCLYNNTNNCHAGLATCTQTGSSFTCACKKGYKGDGVTCDGPMEVLLNKTTTVTEISKSLYQIAAEMTNTDTTTIQDFYKLEVELRIFVDKTSFQNLATCLDLKKEHSLDFAFQQLKFAWVKPRDAIMQFLQRVKDHPKGSSFYQIVLQNYASSFIAYCNTYPILLRTIGYPQFLNEYVTNAIKISVTDLNNYSAKMQVAPLFQNYAVAQWTNHGKELAAKQFQDYLIGYYEGLTVATFESRLQKGRDTIMNMNLMDITSQYTQVSTLFLKGMFELGNMSPNFIRVISDLSLNKLDATLSSQLSTQQMSSVFQLITEKGSLANMVGSLPMVVSLERVGITGLANITKHSLMSLFVKSTQRSEDFIKSWFDIDQYLAALYKRDSIEKYFLINFPSMFTRQLISFPNLILADKSWMEGVTSVETYLDAVKTQFLGGMKFIIQSSPIGYLKKTYGIDDYVYQWWPLAYTLTTYTGLSVADLNTFLPKASISLMGSLPLPKLEQLGPKQTQTLGDFSKSLIAATQNMRLEDLLSSQVYTLQKFRNQNVDTMKMKLKDLVMAETGVAFDKINLGHGKATLMMAAEHTLDGMQREFIQTVKQAHKKDYTSISEISETLTVRQMITIVNHPDAVFLLKKYSELTQKMAELQQTEEQTMKEVLMTFTGLSAEKLEAILTSYIAHSTNSKAILGLKIKEVNTKFQLHLSTLTLSDIITIIPTDEHASAYLPMKFLPYTCANSSFTFTNKTDFQSIRQHCFANSRYLKIINYNLAEMFTAEDVASLKGDTFKFDVMSMDYMSAVYFVEKVNQMLNYAANLPLLTSAPTVGVSHKQLETSTVLDISLKICQQYYPVTKTTFAKVFFLTSNQMSSAGFATFAILKTALQIPSYQKLFTLSPLIIFQIQAAEKTIDQAMKTDYIRIVREMSGVNFQMMASAKGDDVQSYLEHTLSELMIKLFGADAAALQQTFGIGPADTTMLSGIKIKHIMELEKGMPLPLLDIRYHSPLSLMSLILSVYPYTLQTFLRTRPVDIANRLGTNLNNLGEIKTYILNNAAGATSAQIQEYMSTSFGTSYLKGSEIYTAFMNTKLNELTQKFSENMGEKTWMQVMHYVQSDLVYEESMNRQLMKWSAAGQACFTSTTNCTFREMFQVLGRDITKEATTLNIKFNYVPFLGQTNFVQARGFLDMTLAEMNQKTFKQLLQMVSNEYDRLWGSILNQPIIDLMSTKLYNAVTGVTLQFNAILQLLASTSVSRLDNSVPYTLSKASVDFLSKASFSEVNEAIFTKSGGKHNLMFLTLDNVMTFYTGSKTAAEIQAMHIAMMKTYLTTKPIMVLESLYGLKNMSKSVLSEAIDFLGYTPDLMKNDGISAKDINTFQQTTKNDFAWIFPKIVYSVNTADQIMTVIKKSTLAYIYTNSLMSLYFAKGVQSDAGPSYLQNKSLAENIQALTGYNKNNWMVNTTDRLLTSLKTSELKNFGEFRMVATMQTVGDYSAKTKQNPDTLYLMKTKDLAMSMYDDMYKCNGTTLCETKDANSYCYKFGPFGHQCHCTDGFKEVGILCLNVDCNSGNGGCHVNATCTVTNAGRMCKCNAGFSGDGASCTDINECATNNGGCHKDANCINTVGSNRCECKSGFNGDGKTCTDINECLVNNGGCHGNATCTNRPGSKSCQCKSGFSGDGIAECNEINECLTNNGGCHENATCTNTVGSRMCICKKGYTGNGVTSCTDIDECKVNNGGCHSNATCKNLEGSFTCACKRGFVGDGRAECNDINECLTNNGNCHANATCINTLGSRTCKCNQGFSGDAIDQCHDVRCKQADNGGCHRFALCLNTNGSRVCRCKIGFYGDGVDRCIEVGQCGICHNYALCNETIVDCHCIEGYIGDGYEICDDVNECKTDNGGCHLYALCTNSIGSYTCSCNSGFTGDGKTCDDVNECLANNGGCHRNATCTNTVGSYNCKCDQGFSGDGIRCNDVNECLTNNGGCHSNATCTNTIGSRNCQCKRGFHGDGHNCTATINTGCNKTHGGCHSNATCRNMNGTRMCVCNNGFQGDGIRHCTDINECKISNGGCHINATCVNTKGSRTCSCKTGFFGDGIRLCLDANECSIGNHGCHSNATCTNTIGSRTCQCKNGFTGDGVTCNDINECKANNGGCHNFASCTNTLGSRTCSCNNGFTGDGITCSDINECKTNNGGCHQFASCTNTDGSRNCKCNSGFFGDGISCTDLNECTFNNGECHANATCTNTPGSRNCECKERFTGDGLNCVPSSLCGGSFCHKKATCVEVNGVRSCQCNTGYTGSGVVCNDINECKGNNKCHRLASCTNTDGNYTCSCNSGYTGNGYNCTDINECLTNNGGCHKDAICTNTVGSRDCKCKSGFFGDPHTNCMDLNECSFNNGGCHVNATCTNTRGSRKCTCKSGFSGDGTNCTDINECSVNNGGCPANSTCKNTNGSSMCMCKPGYSGDGRNCLDINECLSNNGGCHKDATCKNTMGSFTCRCKSGFFGDGKNLCLDVNECEIGNGGCHVNATCKNLPGSHACTCNTGFSGDGKTCEAFTTCGGSKCHKLATCVDNNGTKSCQCKTGYSGNGVSTCQDVDECKTNNGGCHSKATCTNNEGSFTCTCVKGFSGDGKTCTDIDECKTNNGGCHKDAKCTNTIGSRTCACKSGFTGDGTTSCTDIDECLVNKGGCHGNATCRNTVGSHVCKCKDGYVGDGIASCKRNGTLSCNKNNGGCHVNADCKVVNEKISCVCKTGFSGDGVSKCDDIDECMTNNGGCHPRASCSNTEGSRMCKCSSGFTGDGLHCKDVNECLTNNGGCHKFAICLNTIGSRTCRCLPTYVSNGTECTACDQFHICPQISKPICAQNATHISSFPTECHMNLENCLKNYGYVKQRDGECGAIPNVNFYRNITIVNTDSTLYEIAMLYANTTKDLIQQTYFFNDALVSFIEQKSFVHIATCLDLPRPYSLELIFRKINMAFTKPEKTINDFLERLGRVPEAKSTYDGMKARNKDFVDYCSNYPASLATSGYTTFLNKYVANSFGMPAQDLDRFSMRIKAYTLVTNYAVANWTTWGKTRATLAIQQFIMAAYTQLLLGTKSNIDIKTSQTMLDFSAQRLNVSSTYMSGLFRIGNYSKSLLNVLSELPWSKLEVALGIQNTNTIREASEILRLISVKGAVADTTRMLPLTNTLLRFGFTSMDQLSKYTLLDIMTKYASTSVEFLTSWFQFQPLHIYHMKQYTIGRFFAIHFPSVDIRFLKHITVYTLAEPTFVFGSELQVEQKVMSHYVISMKMILEKMAVGEMKILYGISDLDIGTVPFGMLLGKVTGMTESQMMSLLPYPAVVMMKSMTLLDLLSTGGVTTTQTVAVFAKSLVSSTKEMRMQELGTRPVSSLLTHFGHSYNLLRTMSLKQYISKEVGVPFEQLDFGEVQSTLKLVADDNIIQMQASLATRLSQLKRDDGVAVDSSSGVPSSLTTMQLAVVSAHREAIILLRKFSHVLSKANLTLDHVSTNTSITYGVLMSKYGISSNAVIKTILSDFLIDLSQGDVVMNKPISETIALVGKSDVTSLTLGEMVTLYSETNLNPVTQFRLLKYRCKNFKFDLTSRFDQMQEACFKNNPLLKLSNHKIVRSMTLANLETLAGNSNLDAMNFNFMSAVAYTDKAYRELTTVANKPLIVAANDAGITLAQLNSYNIVTTTLIIFRKLYPVTSEIVGYLFNLNSNILTLAQAATLESLRQMSGANNIQLLHSSSLNVIFEIASGMKTVAQSTEQDLPGQIDILSKISFGKLYNMYNVQDSSTLHSLSIASIYFNWFGVTKATIMKSYILQDSDADMLSRRRVVDALELHRISRKMRAELAAYTPYSLISFLVGFTTYKMQDLLVSTPASTVPSKDSTMGSLLISMGQSRYSISQTDIEGFVRRYYSGVDPAVSGTEVVVGLMKAKFKDYSDKFDVELGTSKWLNIMTYVLKDLQYTKFISMKLANWPASFNQCYLTSMNCTFKSLVAKFHRSLSRDKTIFRLNAQFISLIEQTSIIQYRRFLNVQSQTIQQQTLSEILLATSNEFRRIQTLLFDRAIIDVLSETKITADTALTHIFGSLLTNLASTTLQRLQYLPQYTNILNAKLISHFENITMSRMNTELYGTGFGKTNVLFDPFDVIIRYYAGKSNATTLHATSLQIAKRYLRTKINFDLYKLWGRSMNKTRSVLYIAKEFLSIPDDKMGFTPAQLVSLNKLSIVDYDWVFPEAKYQDSILPSVAKNIVESPYVDIAISSLNQLNAAKRINLSKMRLTTAIGFLTKINAAGAYWFLYNRTLALVGSSKQVLPNHIKFSNIMTNQELGDYAAATKTEESVLYDMKIKDLQMKMYTACASTKDFCVSKDNRSECQQTSDYGHQCRCKTGFAVNTGIMCTNINECLNSPCDVNAICKDTIGSYTCTCKPGFNKQGDKCIDINECLKNPCHPKSTCTNTNGSFVCGACSTGYTGNGFNCTDVDECKTNNGGCDGNATCTNNAGSFECKCNRGYSGDGKTCSEINECATNGGCHTNADCIRKNGNRICTCKTGYSGNGFNCTDINECNLNSACGANTDCTNTVGSYKCACKNGFSGTNGNNCVDIDECATPNICATKCNNVNGGYTCDPCPDHQSGNGTTCTDECKLRPCPEFSKCTNVDHGRVCKCEVGRFMVKNGQGEIIRCDKAAKVIELSGFKVKQNFEPYMKNLTSKKAVAFMEKMEAVLLEFLQKTYPGIADIHITGLSPGSVNMKFLAHFKPGNHTIPSSQALSETVTKGVTGGGLAGVGAVPSPLESSDKNACQLGSDTCGQYGTCVPQSDGDYSCDCNVDYVEIDKKCIKDDELALKIALPIVIILLLVLFIGGACYSYHNNKKRTRGNQYEIDIQTTKGYYPSSNEKSPAELVSYDQGKLPQREPSVVKLYVEDIEGNRFPVPEHKRKEQTQT